VPLIKEIKAKGSPPDSSLLQGTFDTKAQAALCNAIAVDLGFSLEQGRLDVSVHRFTGGLLPPLTPSTPLALHTVQIICTQSGVGLFADP